MAKDKAASSPGFLQAKPEVKKSNKKVLTLIIAAITGMMVVLMVTMTSQKVEDNPDTGLAPMVESENKPLAPPIEGYGLTVSEPDKASEQKKNSEPEPIKTVGPPAVDPEEEARRREADEIRRRKFEREQQAYAYLKEHEPPEGYFVGFSGGKDSIVTLELCRMAEVKHLAFYSATGIDPPEVVRFIKDHYPEIQFLKPPMTFWEAIRKKSPPLRMRRWCCTVLKKDPAKPKIIAALVGNPLLHRIMGIRAEESFRRASWGQTAKMGRMWMYKPIFNWREWHVWDFIEERGLAYPSLYDDGFGRIGCIICPFFMGKNQTKLNLHKDRWPATYRVFEKVVTDWFENFRIDRQQKYSEQTAQEYLAAYYRGFQS